MSPVALGSWFLFSDTQACQSIFPWKVTAKLFVMCTGVHVNNLACFVTQFKYFFFSISFKVMGLCLGVVALWPIVGIVWRKLVL
jgi:hypothetical protein